jgi:hypothetical protein
MMSAARNRTGNSVYFCGPLFVLLSLREAISGHAAVLETEAGAACALC